MQIQTVGSFESQLAVQLKRSGVIRSSILAAVSGGADSMALMSALARLREVIELKVEVATVDHGLRAESAADAQFVVDQATRLGLPSHVRKIALAQGAGVEARAREARYQALAAVRAERGLEFIATAHTASDQAETVVMRLLRGAALGGAAGIQAVRGDRVVRPLLWATREDVEAYLTALNVQFVRDAMNEDPQYFRVKVRTEVMPALASATEGSATRALARFAALAADDDGLLESLADSALRRAVLDDGVLDRVAVCSTPLALRRRLLVSFLRASQVEVDAPLIDDVLEALERGRRATLPGDRVLEVKGGRVWVDDAPPRATRAAEV